MSFCQLQGDKQPEDQDANDISSHQEIAKAYGLTFNNCSDTNGHIAHTNNTNYPEPSAPPALSVYGFQPPASVERENSSNVEFTHCSFVNNQDVRKVVLSKNDQNRVGIQMKSVYKGVFISFIEKNSSASTLGLKFGDQVLEIDGKPVCGCSGSKAMNIIRKSKNKEFEFVIRKCPFEQVVLVNKEKKGAAGFELQSGLVTSINKDSVAARNGLLTNHQIVQVNGLNVIGLNDREVLRLFEEFKSGPITVRLMPVNYFVKLVKRLSPGMMKHSMARSVPFA